MSQSRVSHSVSTAVCKHLIHFRPEPMFESLLDCVERFVVFEEVKVSENTHDARKAVHLADVEELKNFHLKAEARVDHQQYLINRLQI